MVALTRDEAVALVQQGLGFRSDLSTEIILAMRLAQQELEMAEDLPWFLISEDVTLQNDASNLDQLTPPTDFLQTVESVHGSLWYQSGGDWVPLQETDWNELEQARTQNTYISFSHFAVKSPTLIILGPKAPTQQYTFRLRYYAKATDLTSNVTNAWLSNAAQLLIGRTGMMMARDLRDQGAEANFMRMAAEAEEAMAKADAAFKNSARAVMGYGA